LGRDTENGVFDGVVVPVMWTVRVPPAARVVFAGRDRTWLPAVPVRTNALAFGLAGSIAHRFPFPRAGSGSVRVTPVAVPFPMLLNVTVNPAALPAATVAWSAVLATVTSGESTVTVAEEDWFCEAGGSLVALTVAVFGRVAVNGLPDGVVVPVMWTTRDAPAAKVVLATRDRV
jgi:hypothetical protein